MDTRELYDFLVSLHEDAVLTHRQDVEEFHAIEYKIEGVTDALRIILGDDEAERLHRKAKKKSRYDKVIEQNEEYFDSTHSMH